MKSSTRIAAVIAATAAISLTSAPVGAQVDGETVGVDVISIEQGNAQSLLADEFLPETPVQVTFEATTTQPGASDTPQGAGVDNNPPAAPPGQCIATGNSLGVIANCTSDASGKVSSTFQVNRNVAPGAYALEFEGVDSDNVARIVLEQVVVTEPAPAPVAVTPAVTGAATGMIAGTAAAAAIGGLGLFAFGRSRRTATDA